MAENRAPKRLSVTREPHKYRLCKDFTTRYFRHAYYTHVSTTLWVGLLRPQAFIRYRQEILPIPLIVAPVPSPTEREFVAPITGEKDAHVLAAALNVEAAYLISLDKPLAERISQAEELSIQALSPGGFITSELPRHPAYRAIRGQ